MLDWTVLGSFSGYLLLMLWIGFFFSKRQESLGDYYLGGRKMNKWGESCKRDRLGNAERGREEFRAAHEARRGVEREEDEDDDRRKNACDARPVPKAIADKVRNCNRIAAGL